jgi:hypothetical protein
MGLHGNSLAELEKWSFRPTGIDHFNRASLGDAAGAAFALIGPHRTIGPGSKSNHPSGAEVLI